MDLGEHSGHPHRHCEDRQAVQARSPDVHETGLLLIGHKPGDGQVLLDLLGGKGLKDRVVHTQHKLHAQRFHHHRQHVGLENEPLRSGVGHQDCDEAAHHRDREEEEGPRRPRQRDDAERRLRGGRHYALKPACRCHARQRPQLTHDQLELRQYHQQPGGDDGGVDGQVPHAQLGFAPRQDPVLAGELVPQGRVVASTSSALQHTRCILQGQGVRVEERGRLVRQLQPCSAQ
mmetsp:Transcript_116677/g.325138  ORF Transcript_116677/g.325138 Transcript_116677/m.325138 type:complete len:232 (-) Transcript_116677:270-965(-)